jgi:hypothetical protein
MRLAVGTCGPAEIRFVLPGDWSLGDVPELPACERRMEGDRALSRPA